MGRWLLLLVLSTSPLLAQSGADTPVAETHPAPVTDAPLPPMRDLLQVVERKELSADTRNADYTYHVHTEEKEVDGKGNVKKTTTEDSESITIDGVRVDRVVARNGKPLTADEAKKESEKIDKQVAKAKERRAKFENKGKETDANGDDEITAARMMELGTFSNERRVDLNGRPTIMADYTGNPNARTHDAGEAAFRYLVGTVWIDEQDKEWVRVEGHFVSDYKIGGGLVADVKKDSRFAAERVRVAEDIWLPAKIEGQGKVRILLVAGFSGAFTLNASDYRKFRATSTILGSNGVVDANGNLVPQPEAGTPGTPKP